MRDGVSPVIQQFQAPSPARNMAMHRSNEIPKVLQSKTAEVLADIGWGRVSAIQLAIHHKQLTYRTLNHPWLDVCREHINALVVQVAAEALKLR